MKMRTETREKPREENYLPSQEGMAHNQFIKMMIIFSIAFITVLILKVVLPSYEEAVSLPYKIPEGGPAPPPYSEA
eukprot:bmy_11450T0